MKLSQLHMMDPMMLQPVVKKADDSQWLDSCCLHSLHFLHSFAIEKQLRVAQIEELTQV